MNGMPVPERICSFLKILDFIRQHQQADVHQLMLKKNSYPDIPMAEAVCQIQARRKAKDKLPSWFAQAHICYPSLLSLEQCSSERTAQFKASLLQGKLLIDLTGGMGVDTAAFCSRFEQVIYLERNAELQPLTAYNLHALGHTQVTCLNADSMEWLSQFTGKADWVYVDPARRDTSGGKVVRLSDCEPDVLAFRELLFQKSAQVLLKASPMLDIDLAIREMGFVERVYVVAVDNEVKELLFHWHPQATSEPELFCVNLLHTAIEPEIFRFSKAHESQLTASFAEPQTYIYEPNAAILKAGAFKSVAEAFSLYKLHPNSHLYTSEQLHTDFPGRIFTLLGTSKVDKKSLRPWLPDNKANITVRNFPATVAQIRTQTGIQEGGDKYLFATTLPNNQKVMLVCVKV